MRISLACLIAAAAICTSCLNIAEAGSRLHAHPAESKDIGGGFMSHGEPVAVAYNRGMVCTSNVRGDGLILFWLDGDSLVEINTDTGEYREHENPYIRRAPFCSMLASDGRFYTHIDSSLIAYNPIMGELILLGETEGTRAAFGITEDENGVIWVSLHPDASIISYNPATGEIHDYGSLNREDYRQYPTHLVSDGKGWLYFLQQRGDNRLFMFHPGTGRVEYAFSDELKISFPGWADQMRLADDGCVYVRARVEGEDEERHYKLYEGKATRLPARPDYEPSSRYITARTAPATWHRDLPGGEKVRNVDMDRRLAVIEDTTGRIRQIEFNYSAPGALIMGVAKTQAGTIAGGTTYPRRFFSYNPETDEITFSLPPPEPPIAQWNIVTMTGDGKWYAGGYSNIGIIEWDPSQEWTNQGRTAAHNPRAVVERPVPTRPHVWRPTAILAYPPEERYIVLAGFSEETHPGGGLYFWDRKTGSGELLTHRELVPNHDNFSLAGLPDNKLLVGTTSWQYASKQRHEQAAKLYIMDMESKKIEWQGTPVEDAQMYHELFSAPNGEIYVIVTDYLRSHPRVYVFDAGRRTIIREIPIPGDWGGDHALHRWQPMFVPGPAGRIFVLFRSVIAELNVESYELIERARLPEGIVIWSAGVYHDGRFYFGANRSELYSWQLP